MKLTDKWTVSMRLILAASVALGFVVPPSFTHAADTPVKAFMDKDAGQLAGLWSDDMVVTSPLSKFVSKRQVLGMVQAAAARDIFLILG